MTAPKIQISWGELIDKITILEIKADRLNSQAATKNVRRELTALNSVAGKVLRQRKDVQELKQRLKTVNNALWDIEDKIRAKEAAKLFDHEFIELARSVYVNNDRRGHLKRQINAVLNSELVEEKQYTIYSA
jgi:peptidoglycan hydrolase CwlO-like protein